MAAWVRASHWPLGSPVRYFSRISASWMAVARSAWMLCWPCRFHAPFLLRRRWDFDLDLDAAGAFAACDFAGSADFLFACAGACAAIVSKIALTRRALLAGKRKPYHLVAKVAIKQRRGDHCIVGCRGASRLFPVLVTEEYRKERCSRRSSRAPGGPETPRPGRS